MISIYSTLYIYVYIILDLNKIWNWKIWPVDTNKLIYLVWNSVKIIRLEDHYTKFPRFFQRKSEKTFKFVSITNWSLVIGYQWTWRWGSDSCHQYQYHPFPVSHIFFIFYYYLSSCKNSFNQYCQKSQRDLKMVRWNKMKEKTYLLYIY